MSTLLRLIRARRALPEPEERRQVRESAGLSLRAFANAIGVSPSTVARWESGEREPSGPFLFVYVDGLRTLQKAREQNSNE